MRFLKSINEYLNQEEVWLKKYLNMSDDEKYKNLAYDKDYLVGNFIKTIDLNDYFEEEVIDAVEEFFNDDNKENYQFLEEDYISDKFLIDFGKYIEHNIDSYDLPTSFYFSWPEIIKKQWLIHLTDYAKDIWNNGFTYGTYDISQLGLTTYISQDSKKYGGYNFAYTVEDFLRYGRRSESGQRFRYGQEVIMFRCSGVRAYHSGDEEEQTIFWGKYATDIIWLEEGEYESGDKEGEDCWFIESRKTDQRIVEKDELDDLIHWVQKNYDQYRKHIQN